MRGKITARTRVTSGNIPDEEARALRLQNQKRTNDTIWIVTMLLVVGVASLFIAALVSLF